MLPSGVRGKKLRSILFDMSTMHLYGSAFYDFLRLRKRFFVDGLGWDIPNDGLVEMDQYDTPHAHYSLVVADGEVVAGARCQRGDVTWGHYSCMMRDAARGNMPGIPHDLIEDKEWTPEIWEGTRLVISDDIGSVTQRTQAMALIIDGLMRTMQPHGATYLQTLSPVALARTVRFLGYETERVSRAYVCGEDGREYAVFRTTVARSVDRLKALGIDADMHMVIGPHASAAE